MQGMFLIKIRIPAQICHRGHSQVRFPNDRTPQSKKSDLGHVSATSDLVFDIVTNELEVCKVWRLNNVTIVCP